MTNAAGGSPPTPTVLIVLDGWGVRAEPQHNAIHAARTPRWDALWRGPSTLLDASGERVGLPPGQMGNSEVGHMNIGAGRVVHQDLTRIDRAVASGALAENPALRQAMAASAERGATLHILGLLSPGGVHSHEDQIAALAEAAAAAAAAGKRRRGGAKLRLHAFLDGRDTPPKSAAASLRRFEARFPGVIASITGRYYAMDRDARWQRTERAWRLLADGDTPWRFPSPLAALEAAYARGETDEFVQPSAVQASGAPGTAIADGDAVVFMNFRADRARQLSRAFLDAEFEGFPRPARPRLSTFVTLTRYADDLPAQVAFAPERVDDSLGEVLARRGMTQLRLAETEKYAHVTYFFSGRRETPFAGEDRVLVPSPQVATYDLAPQMSAGEVTDKLVNAIAGGIHDCIVCNYANGDMVGHTGDFAAAVRAVETVDECLGRVCEALRRRGGQALITADHGNAERMLDASTNQPHTAHTSSFVPLVYAGPQRVRFVAEGALSDVAPTLLALMGMEAPPSMTGRSLATVESAPRPQAAATAVGGA